MGFEPPRRVYTLDFADTELDGLEVTATGAPLGMMLELGNMVDGIGAMPDPEKLATLPADEQAAQLKMVAESLAKLRGIVDMYAKVLRSWNYEENGVAVPATAAGLLTLDPAHVMLIIRSWQKAVAEAPAPLSLPSSGGAPSLVASLPMEPLSPSLAS